MLFVDGENFAIRAAEVAAAETGERLFKSC
jgi:hypothetical protein